MDQEIHFATSFIKLQSFPVEKLVIACNKRIEVSEDIPTTFSAKETTCPLCRQTVAYRIVARKENRQRHYIQNSRLYLSENMGQQKTFFGRYIKHNTSKDYSTQKLSHLVLLRDVLAKDEICGKLYIAQHIWLKVPLDKFHPIPPKSGPTPVIKFRGTPTHYLKISQEVDYEVDYFSSRFLDDSERLEYYQWLSAAIKGISEKTYLNNRVEESIHYLRKGLERRQKTG